MKRSLVVILIGGLVLGIAAGITLHMSSIFSSAEPETDFASSDSALEVGKLAPNFLLPDLNDKQTSLTKLTSRGEITLGFFCGCDRCKAAATKIAEEQHKGYFKNFVIVTPLRKAYAKAFITSSGLHGHVFVDSNDKVTSVYNSTFCPRIWIISKTNAIRYDTEQAVSGEALIKSIAQIENIENSMYAK